MAEALLSRPALSQACASQLLVPLRPSGKASCALRLYQNQLAAAFGKSAVRSLRPCDFSNAKLLCFRDIQPVPRRLPSRAQATNDGSPPAGPWSHQAHPPAVRPQSVFLLSLAAAAVAVIKSALGLALSKLRSLFAPLTSQEAFLLRSWGLNSAGGKAGLLSSACFAAMSQAGGGGAGGSSSTPLTVIASGMAKWLELYSGLLLIRVLLSWFPNIDWERQPLQAIRDMSDPYLNLFRNIMPPFWGALDLSPMLAFLVLGMLTSLLNTTVYS